MRRHLRLECGIPPQFHCPHCNYVSNRKGNINAHIAIKHENRTFDCTKCSKKFKSAQGLSIHMYTECRRKQSESTQSDINSPLGLLAAIAKQPVDLNPSFILQNTSVYEAFNS